MRPALSLVVFTVSAGAGLGMLVWIVLGLALDPAQGPALSRALTALAGVLLAFGLGASSLHLASPRRAWRALVRWRTSWLSREALLALACWPVGLAFWLALGGGSAWAWGLGALLSGLALATVYSTAMIYACLKTVPSWHRGPTRATFMLFAVASGGVLWLVCRQVGGAPVPASPWTLGLAALLIVAGVLKWSHWKRFSRIRPDALEVAHAMRLEGQVRLLDAGHAAPTFLTREFGFELPAARARALKWLVLIGGLGVPAITLVLAPHWSVLAGIFLGVGLLVERWLFFAEARHVVRLFHGDGPV